MRQEMKGPAYRDFNIHRVQEESTMKKRITALALVCMLSLASLVGCGGGGTEGQTSNADTVKIGGLAPLTGNLSIYGIATDNGVKMAIDEINAAGGVLGKQI